jgi:hypothetical protein
LAARRPATRGEQFQPTVTILNCSGRNVLVRLMGPTQSDFRVAYGQRGTVNVLPGKYFPKFDYGGHFSKGKPLVVTERSRLHIKLGRAVPGNYSSHGITKPEFDRRHASPSEFRGAKKAPPGVMKGCR